MSFWQTSLSALALAAAGAVGFVRMGDPPPPPPPGDYNISFDTARGNLAAWPEPLFAKATVSGPDVPTASDGHDPQTGDWMFYWEDLDTATAWNKLVSPWARQNDPRISVGRVVGHVPSAPGTYTWRCTAINKADWTKTATNTVSFTVASEDGVWLSSETWLIGDGDWTGAPAHDIARRYTNPLDAFEAVNTGPSRIRILFKRGLTYNMSSSGGAGNLGSNDNLRVFVVGEWGSGADPIINYTGGGSFINFNWRVNTLRVYGIDYRSNSQITTAPFTQGGISDFFMSSGITPDARECTFYNCTFRNIRGFEGGPGTNGSRLSFIDCAWDGWSQTAAICNAGSDSGSWGTARGIDFKQNPNAFSEPRDEIGFNGGFGFRIEPAFNLCYDAIWGHNRLGWFNESSSLGLQDIAATGNAIRGGGGAGCFINASRLMIEKAPVGFGFTGAGGAIANITIQDSRFYACSLATNFSGTSFDNCTFYDPPGLRESENSFGWFMQWDNMSTALLLSKPNYVANCSFYSVRGNDTGGGSTSITNNTDGLNLTLINNVFNAPYRFSPLTDGSFDLTAYTEPLYNGYNEEDGTPAGFVRVDGRSGTWNNGGMTLNGQAIRGISAGNYVHLAAEPASRIITGAALTNSSGGTGTAGSDSGSFRAGTAHPAWMLEFSGMGATRFKVGATLTSGDVSAQIRWVDFTSATAGRLWLGPVTGGSFANGNALTDSAGASGTAAANQVRSGMYASFVPSGAPVGSASATRLPRRDIEGVLRTLPADRGAVKAA